MIPTSLKSCCDRAQSTGSRGASSNPLANGYAAQAQRMKTFAGQRQFQAPVADDFAKGMLACRDEAPPLKHPATLWAGLLAGLAVWLRRQRLG